MVRRVPVETVAGGGQGMTQQQETPQRTKPTHYPAAAPSLAPAEERLALSLPERKEARSVLAAYTDFWSQLRFRKGWAEPPFGKEEVQPMLEEAAALVAKVRSDLDRKDPGFKMRMVDGSARELLHGVSALYAPQDHPDRFVTDLAHATLQDGAGYVEGLTAEGVDAYLRRFSQGRLPPPDMPVGCRGVYPKGGGGGGAVRSSTGPAAAPVAVVDGDNDKHEKEREEEQQEEESRPVLARPEEGAPLVRSSSVLGQEGEIEDGLVQGWRQLMGGDVSGGGGVLGKVVSLVQSGWARGNPRRLLLLRRLVLALHAVEGQAEEVLALAEAQEEGMEVEEEVEQEGGKAGEETMALAAETGGEEGAPTAAAAAEAEAPMGATAEPMAAETAAAAEAPMAAAETGEGEAEGENEETRIEIERVREDTEALKAQIADLTNHVATLSGQKEGEGSDAVGGNGGQQQQERVLEELQGRCAKFVEGLVHALNVLDELHVTEADRPLRKSQVLQVQQLIDDCEQARERLRALRAELQRKRQEKEAERQRRMEEEQEREEQGDEEQQQPPMRAGGGGGGGRGLALTLAQLREMEAALAPHWRRMRMRPRVETAPLPHAYVIAVQAPNMRPSDLAVQVGARGETLTIKGYRAPTPQELQQLVCLAAAQQQGQGVVTLEGVLMAGEGRFGSFVESLRLPRDADVEGMEAAYEKGGVLRVVIPRIQQQPPQPQRAVPVAPSPMGGFGFGGGSAGYPFMAGGGGGRGGGGGGGGRPAGFWGDQDLWW